MEPGLLDVKGPKHPKVSDAQKNGRIEHLTRFDGRADTAKRPAKATFTADEQTQKR